MISLSYDTAQFTQKIGGYMIGPATALENFSLQVKAQDFKRRISGLLYPTNGDEIAEKLPKSGRLVASRKIDGEFCLLCFDGREALTVNPGGTVRAGLPCILEAAAILKAAGVGSAIIACELFHRKRQDGRERVHDAIRVIRNPRDESELNDISLAPFGIVELDDSTITEWGVALERLAKLFDGAKLVRTVDFERIESSSDAARLYDKWVLEENSEGLVVWGEQGGWKIKPTHTIDAAVIGFSESVEDRKGMLHDLLVGVKRPDETFHILTRVGGGFSEKQRRDLFGELKESLAPSNYTEVNSDHVAYEMVRPKFVIELKCLDIISEKARGGEINRMVVEWQPDDARWVACRRLPFVSIISPQFVRLRDDKRASLADIHIRQIDGIVPIPDVDVRVDDIQLPKSEMVERVVYTKSQGDKMMVRKFLLWKTNKEASRDFLPFVVYYTDFSSGRAEPIARNIQPANTVEQANAMFAEMIEKSIKKGWEKVI